jgi:hypothetical protein
MQETMLRAWRAIERFEPRGSLAAWLYRIATNVCLRMIEQRARRAHEVGPELQPYPDRLLEDLPADDPGPAAQVEQRESIGPPERSRACTRWRRLPGGALESRWDVVRRHWPGEEIALCLVAAECAQALELICRFDAFGDGSQAEVRGEVHDGGDDALVFVVGSEALHE